MKILLSGFEPFKEWEINSSWQGVKLAQISIPDSIAIELPVDYLLAREKLTLALETHKPEVCLCCGLTPREAFSIELRARKPEQFSDFEGEDFYRGYWDWRAMRSHIESSNKPVNWSRDAGSYVCESTYWTLLDFKSKYKYPQKTAFLHVPPLSDEFSAELIAEVIKAIIQS